MNTTNSALVFATSFVLNAAVARADAEATPPPSTTPAPATPAPATTAPATTAPATTAPATTAPATTAPATATATAKLKVIVLDLKGESLTSAQASALTGLVTVSLSEFTALEVVSGADLRQMLELEGQKQQLGCEQDAACLAEIAGALGARMVAYGQVEKLGSRYVMNLNLQDARAGKSAGRFSLQGDGLDAISAALPDAVTKMTVPFLAAERVPTTSASSRVDAPTVTKAPPPAPAPAKEEQPFVHFDVVAFDLVKVPSIGPTGSVALLGAPHLDDPVIDAAGGVHVSWALLEAGATFGAVSRGTSNGLKIGVRAISFGLGPVALIEPSVGVDLESRQNITPPAPPPVTSSLYVANTFGLSWLKLRTSYATPFDNLTPGVNGIGADALSVELWLDVTSIVRAFL